MDLFLFIDDERRGAGYRYTVGSRTLVPVPKVCLPPCINLVPKCLFALKLDKWDQSAFSLIKKHIYTFYPPFFKKSRTSIVLCLTLYGLTSEDKTVNESLSARRPEQEPYIYALLVPKYVYVAFLFLGPKCLS